MAEEQTVEELQQKVAESRQLEKELTKKNDQFIFDVKKLLAEATIDEAKKVTALHSMLTELVAGQKTGATAKQLYGTPTEAAFAIVNAPEPEPELTFWRVWLDNSLLLLIFLSAITGLLALLTNQATTTQGIMSIIVGALSGGFSFYLIYRYIYIYDLPGADVSKRPGLLKTGWIMALCFIPWFLIFAFAAFIPEVVNPKVSPFIAIALGGGTYFLRRWLQKNHGLRGTMFMRR